MLFRSSPVYSYDEIKQMRGDLMEWAQTYRWDVDWHGQQEKDLWPILRIVRGFSNTLWERERDVQRSKEKLTDDERAVMNAHFANMLSGIGRLCYRSWEGMQNVCPYLLEDNIADEKQASGGSGKSVLVNLVVGSAVNVFCVDMKDFLTIVDAKFCLSDLQIGRASCRERV